MSGSQFSRRVCGRGARFAPQRAAFCLKAAPRGACVTAQFVGIRRRLTRARFSSSALKRSCPHNLLSTLMASLPADVTKHALSFLVVEEIPRGAALCKAWAAAARAPSYGSHCARRRWPSTVSGALRSGAAARAARMAARGRLVRRRDGHDRISMTCSCSSNSRRMQKCFEETAKIMITETREPHCETASSLTCARVDTSKDNRIPATQGSSLRSIALEERWARCCTRPDYRARVDRSFGRGGGGGSFAANPLLRGALPASYRHPTLLDVDPQDVLTTWLSDMTRWHARDWHARVQNGRGRPHRHMGRIPLRF